jgi:hypothetical protein
LLYAVQTETPAGVRRTIPNNDIEKWNAKLEELLRPKRAKKNDVEKKRTTISRFSDDSPVTYLCGSN